MFSLILGGTAAQRQALTHPFYEAHTPEVPDTAKEVGR